METNRANCAWNASFFVTVVVNEEHEGNHKKRSRVYPLQVGSCTEMPRTKCPSWVDAVEEVGDERAGLPIGAVIKCYCARRFAAFDAEAE
jgi:hypothetical protein